MKLITLAGSLLTALLILLSAPRAAANRFNTEISSSARGLSMGNAVINTERGPYAIFYNPANLSAKGKTFTIQPLNVQVDANEPLYGSMSSGKVVNFTNLSAMQPYLKQNPNAYVGGRYSVYPNFTSRFFSLGMLYEVNEGSEYRNSDEAVRVKARDRFAPIAALSFRLLSGILRIGASVSMLTVGDADTWVRKPYDTAALNYATRIQAGSGLSKTAGATLTFPFRYLPSFSFVARDIGGTSFNQAPRVPFGTLSKGEGQQMTLDMAAAMTIYLARRVEFKMEFDWKDYLQRIRGSFMQRTFYGVEFVFFDLVHLRGGLAHGYWSGGLGIHTRRASLEVGAYSDELEGRFRTREDKRYVLQYTMSFGY